MVDAQIKKELLESSGEHTFVLQWKATPRLDSFSPNMTRRERLNLLSEQVKTIKSRLLSYLHNVPGLSINDLPGMNEVIITANNHDWLQVIPELEETDEAVLLPNIQFHSM